MNAYQEMLIAAKALIADPEHWTQQHHAIANTGMPVDVFDEDAYAFCADGACLRAAGRSEASYAVIARALDAAVLEMLGERDGLVALNDGEVDGYPTPEAAHRAVLEAFEIAIDKMETI